jgi:hypothetical protein
MDVLLTFENRAIVLELQDDSYENFKQQFHQLAATDSNIQLLLKSSMPIFKVPHRKFPGKLVELNPATVSFEDGMEIQVLWAPVESEVMVVLFRVEELKKGCEMDCPNEVGSRTRTSYSLPRQTLSERLAQLTQTADQS